MTLSVKNLPARTNRGRRDAINAAATARRHTRGMTEATGEVVVPAGRW